MARWRRWSHKTLGAAAVVALAFSAPSSAVRADAPEKGTESAPKAGGKSIQAAIISFVGDRRFASAKIGVAVVDVESGRTVAGHEEHLVVNPASNAKLYTAAAALALHGHQYRYRTALVGKIEGQEVVGSLGIRGDGDPSLESRDLWAMAHELHEKGVRRITGDIVVDHKFFDDETTPPAFEQQPDEWAPFRAPVCAVAINENTIRMGVRPTEDGKPAAAWFEPSGFVDVDGAIVTGGSGADSIRLDLAGKGDRLSAKLGGKIGKDAGVVHFTRRVEDPRLLAGFVMRDVLQSVGIRFGGKVVRGPSKGAPLVVHHSDPLGVLLHALGKSSDNFYAEMVFKSLGPSAWGKKASSADAAKTVAKWVKDVGAMDGGVKIVNGSGLFDSNRVTASSLARLLRVAALDPNIASDFQSQLAVGGVDGTLRGRFRDTDFRRRVRAKTGTLNDVASLSGYVYGAHRGAPIYAFSIVANGVDGKVAAARAGTDAVVREIVRAAEER